MGQKIGGWLHYPDGEIVRQINGLFLRTISRSLCGQNNLDFLNGPRYSTQVYQIQTYSGRSQAFCGQQ